MDKNLVIDNNVGLTALRLYIENSNMEVGQVTSRHLVFSELIVQVRGDMSLDDAEEVMKLCFANAHTVKEGKGKKHYESPLKDYYYKDQFGIDCVKISPRLVDLIVEEVKRMEVNDENVVAACIDLMIAGRMFQELTIDACKTMLQVKIPYGEDMAHVKLNSRENEEEDFNIKCDWKYMNSSEEEQAVMRANLIKKQVGTLKTPVRRFENVLFTLNKNGSKTTVDPRGKDKIKVRHIADFQHAIRTLLFSKGLDFANEMMQEKQELSLDIMSEITAAMRRPEMKQAYQLCVFFHDAFRTIQSYQSKSIADAIAVYPKKSAALDEHVLGIKTEAKKAIRALSNQFRVEFKKLGLSERDMILVLLHTVLVDGNNAGYAHLVLEQEFFKFAIDCYKNDDKVHKYTEDALVHCDFEEGDTVFFQAGKAVKDDKKAYATVPLCGDFLIRKSASGKLVASKLISDIVVTPDIEQDKLVFITKPGGGKDDYTCKHLRDITRQAINDSKITLVPFIKGKDVHDAIVIDGNIVGSFRCSYARNGIPINSEVITSMYLYKEGTVEHMIISDQGGSVGEVAVITLKDVKTVNVPDIKRNLISEEKQKKAEEFATRRTKNRRRPNILFSKEELLVNMKESTESLIKISAEEKPVKKKKIKMFSGSFSF